MKNSLLLVVSILLMCADANAQLSGTYTIGTNTISGETGHYATLSAAVAALNTSGVNGPCMFYFTDNTTYVDTAITLGCTGTSATNTITFKPYTGVTATISLTSVVAKTIDGMWVIGSNNNVAEISLTTLIPTSYVTIDGSNTNGGTTKDLTIQGPSGNYQRSVFRIYGDNDNITIKNCIIINNVSSASTNAAINVTNYNNGTSFIPNNTNYNPDNFTVQNCTLTSTTGTASAGFHVSNSGTLTVGLTGLTVSGNTIAGNLRGM
ncbi:MAG: hypothetical protein HY966_02165, partial [Ignavibacteriales bacterium]|nr:hypothetical protein [Ignavibacteriales bacterium]